MCARILLRSLAGWARAGIVACALFVAFPRIASALVLTVPDDVPTIQAALDVFAMVDRPAPDTLRLRGLDFPEAPTLHTSIVVEWAPQDPGEPRPRITGLAVELSTGWLAGVRGIDVTGPVTMSVGQPSEIWFEDCRFDGRILGYSSDGRLSPLTFRRCRFRAEAHLSPGGECVIDSCDFESGISVNWSDARLRVTRSTIQGGGAGVGIDGGYLTELTVTETTIRGFSTGINVEAEGSAVIADNTIEDCSYTGITVSNGDDVQIARNVVRRCGTGIRSAGYRVAVTDNIVEACADIGVFAIVDGVTTVARNVVSHCGNAGIWLAGEPLDAGHVHNNTTCFNAGSGLVSEIVIYYSATVFEIVQNVAFGNGGYGLDWRFTPVGAVSCNDWFGNALGPVGGGARSAADFVEDPLFCDPAGGDFHPNPYSPLLNRPGCGLVGALDVGCPARIVDGFGIARVSPNPASGLMHIEITLPVPADVEVELFDIQGRSVATLTRGLRPAGPHTIEWSGQLSGAPAPAGLYLVRYRFPGGQDDARLVLAR